MFVATLQLTGLGPGLDGKCHSATGGKLFFVGCADAVGVCLEEKEEEGEKVSRSSSRSGSGAVLVQGKHTHTHTERHREREVDG